MWSGTITVLCIDSKLTLYTSTCFKVYFKKISICCQGMQVSLWFSSLSEFKTTCAIWWQSSVTLYFITSIWFEHSKTHVYIFYVLLLFIVFFFFMWIKTREEERNTSKGGQRTMWCKSYISLTRLLLASVAGQFVHTEAIPRVAVGVLVGQLPAAVCGVVTDHCGSDVMLPIPTHLLVQVHYKCGLGDSVRRHHELEGVRL